jgi:hypothetical protein
MMAELGALVDPPDPEAVGLRVGFGRGGVERGAAFRAEAVCTLGPALGGFDVDLRRAALEPRRRCSFRSALCMSLTESRASGWWLDCAFHNQNAFFWNAAAGVLNKKVPLDG